MNRILLLICLLTLSFNSWADYRPLKLYEMIIKAEEIVYGTIIELDSSTFTLDIEGSITSESGTIVVRRFEDWPCASRWTNYKIGQRLFLFLAKWNGNLVTMSAGNEGELPILDNSVFLHGFSIPIPSPPPPKGVKLRKDILYFDVEHHNIYGNKYFGMKWNLNDFIKTVSYIRDCFDFDYGQYRRPTNWKVKCETDELQKIALESKLVDWIYKIAANKEVE